MSRALLSLFIALPAALAAQQAGPIPTVRPAAGLIITRSVRIAPGTWRLPAPASADSALITVRGENITVDFQGATLLGMPADADPDLAYGVAVRVDGGRNIRIVHARIRGYRFGILARGTRGLTLVDDDVSYGWKPRLYSLIEHESLADWLSFHHNERGEWLRFGAGLYLEGVTGGEIRGCRGVQGMNGLMLARSDSLRILDNEFSFNSGLGIGLYRSSWNVMVRNRLDYDVRGYSHRFYHRGQDSADLLMFEQSSHNVVAWNSATHGGDGLFLWAGQSTMDSGTGGANDNLFWENDFSYAPANGMEATFSRNTFTMNRAVGNDYGLWGGYSFGSRIIGNTFAGNRTGIAIEHGQDNHIVGNRFIGDTTAINLWANPIEPSDWGYPKHRDTRSRDYRIERNMFDRTHIALRATQTSGLAFTNNHLFAVDSTVAMSDTSGYRDEGTRVVETRDLATAAFEAEPDTADLVPPPIPGVHSWPGTPLSGRNRSAIIVDEWGPYDWKSPKLWPVDSARAVPLRLAVLGPKGRWRLTGRRGVATVSTESGRVGDTIAVTPSDPTDWSVMLEYTGGATVSPRGARRAAGARYPFGLGRFEPRIEWNVRFFAWSDSTDPRSRAEAFGVLLQGAPLLARREPRLDYQWYRPLIGGLPQARFALEALGTVTLPAGDYTLRTISDDGVRVWVDGALAIDDWSLHESAVDVAPLPAGRHELKVQYFQVDGWVELRLDIVRGRERSTGSPGPH